MPSRLSATVFPEATPLHRFFLWNEARRLRDPRYILACDIHRLLARFGGTARAFEICSAHLAIRPLIRWRYGERMLVSAAMVRSVPTLIEHFRDSLALAAARRLVGRLRASIGSPDVAAHAAVFAAFEDMAAYIDLGALARLRPRRKAAKSVPGPGNILVIKLSALGDFIQALGPAAAIRRHHAGDRITLLTTRPYAEFARQTGLFDNVLVDRRPKALDVGGWLSLRRALRQGRFDRVYDLQTSDRSSHYAGLFRPGRMPEWSGIAWRCSHPHADLDRYWEHTIDKQAEQLLMAGIYPVPLPVLSPAVQPLPVELADRRFVLLIPGSSPRHLAKRWPVTYYAELARRLAVAGYTPVVVGANGEEHLADRIREACPQVVNLVGHTDITALAGLSQAAAFTVGNDTGVTHIAAAGGNPVVVLFSQASTPSRCAPRGRFVRVLAVPDLADLPVETVFAEAMAIADDATGVRWAPGSKWTLTESPSRER
jgi:ADP-heptose:LPS heptosyltransferase